jgi:hypothetical protein
MEEEKEWMEERRKSCSTHVVKETCPKYVLMSVTWVAVKWLEPPKCRHVCITVRMAPSCHSFEEMICNVVLEWTFSLYHLGISQPHVQCSYYSGQALRFARIDRYFASVVSEEGYIKLDRIVIMWIHPSLVFQEVNAKLLNIHFK